MCSSQECLQFEKINLKLQMANFQEVSASEIVNTTE